MERRLHEHFPIFVQKDFENVLTQEGWQIGINGDCPSELRRRLIAASLSYQIGNKSIDHVAKRYLSEVSYQEADPDRLDRQIERFITSRVDIQRDRLVDLTDREETSVVAIMAEWTLLRVPFSTYCALSCAHRGALFESLALCRALLEQVAWAVKVHQLDDPERVMRQSATGAITDLKRVHPNAGEFYGWLSNHAHWAYDAHVKALDLKTERVGILLANSLYKITAFCALLVLLDVTWSVHEFIFERIGLPGEAGKNEPPGVKSLGRTSSRYWIDQVVALAPEQEDLLRLQRMIRH